MADVKAKDYIRDGVVFKGFEQGSGSGPSDRQIKIYRKGKPDDVNYYNIAPNPHNNKKYNKKGRQQGFYDAMTKAIADNVIPPDAGGWPQVVANIIWESEQYVLTKVV